MAIFSAIGWVASAVLFSGPSIKLLEKKDARK